MNCSSWGLDLAKDNVWDFFSKEYINVLGYSVTI